jgi:hypothetical protein
MASLDESRTQIAGLPEPIAAALRPFVSQRAQLRQTITAAPAALTSMENGLGSGETFLASARALASSAMGTLPLLPQGLHAATELLRTAPAPLERAASLLREVEPAVPPTLAITRAALPSFHPLQQILTRAEPMLLYIGQRGCDIENFGVTMRSMTGYGGTGQGPIGPPMEFRAQVLPAPDALAPVGAVDAPLHKAYAPPCTYVDRIGSENPPLAIGARP